MFKLNQKKIENALLLLMCVGKFLVSGKATKKISRLDNILVVHLSKLGDMVCTTPMFHAIKQKYPRSCVYVLGAEPYRELLRGNSDVDRYLGYQSSIFKNIKMLKKEKIDYACLAYPNFTALAVMYLAGIPTICVPQVVARFCPLETKTYRFLRRWVLTAPHDAWKYAPREYLRLLEPIGIYTDEIKTYLFYTSEAENKAMAFLQQHEAVPGRDFLVGIAPGAGHKLKLWPTERFAYLADYLQEKYQAKIFLITGPDEQDLVEKMMASIKPTTKVINPKFSIEELKAFISKLSFFVSVSTGPMHFADAFDIPLVVVVGPADEVTQTPRGVYSRIVKPERKEAAIYTMCTRIFDYEEARRQAESTTVEMVKEKIDELISLIKDKK
jgi:ADP-heptose:LPS heptosyltransferase